MLIYSNEDDSVKRFKAERYHPPKGVIENYRDIINGKSFYHRPINSDIKGH